MKSLITIVLAVGFAASIMAGAASPPTTNTVQSVNINKREVSMEKTIYDFSVKNNAGQEVAMSDFKGRVLLIVNTASKCGFTKQYKGLEALHRKYADRGLVVLGFPCNQFGGQEPGTADEIASFCELNFGVTFPLMEKIKVNGKEADPLYVYLKDQQKGLLGGAIKWNFTKFLVDREGKVVARYAPDVKPESLNEAIEALL